MTFLKKPTKIDIFHVIKFFKDSKVFSRIPKLSKGQLSPKRAIPINPKGKRKLNEDQQDTKRIKTQHAITEFLTKS